MCCEGFGYIRSRRCGWVGGKWAVGGNDDFLTFFSLFSTYLSHLCSESLQIWNASVSPRVRCVKCVDLWLYVYIHIVTYITIYIDFHNKLFTRRPGFLAHRFVVARLEEQEYDVLVSVNRFSYVHNMCIDFHSYDSTGRVSCAVCVSCRWCRAAAPGRHAGRVVIAVSSAFALARVRNLPVPNFFFFREPL